MRTKKTVTGQKSIEKEVKNDELVSFLDRHNSHWFIETETNNLKIGNGISDFLNGNTENFKIKRTHSCDVKTWKLVETTDGKFVFLTNRRGLK